jgi:hypothetical protein
MTIHTRLQPAACSGCPLASVESANTPNMSASTASSGVRRITGMPLHHATIASANSPPAPICIPLTESGIDHAVSARQTSAARRSQRCGTSATRPAV